MTKLTQLTPQVLEIRSIYKQGQLFKFMLCSDVHFDNPKCQRDMFFRHLDKAKEENAKVFIFGDLYCVMNGNYDPRRNKKAVRPEHNVENYLDTVIFDTVEKLSPYAENIALISQGNHETSILNKLETDLTQRTVDALQEKYKSNVKKGLYQGFVRFVFEQENGGAVRTCLLFFHHGAFGGVVTKGALSVLRFASIVPDADIVVTGHTHDEFIIPHERFIVNKSGKVITRPQYHVRTPTYKQEFDTGSGWATERIVLPKPLGCVFMNAVITGKGSDLNLGFEIIR